MKATSGSEEIAFSTRFCMSSDWSSEVEGTRSRLDRCIALVELRDELLTQRHEQQAREDECADAGHDPFPRGGENLLEQRLVASLDPADGADIFLRHLAVDQHGNQRGHEGQRQDEGADEREDDGDRHRREHLALDTAEGEQRREHEQDDGLAVDRRLDHFLRRLEHLVQPLGQIEQAAFVMLSFGQAPQAVFDDDDRPVDDQAEVERAEAHQIARHAIAVHPDRHHQERQRNDQRGDNRGADIAEQPEQGRDDQDRAFDEVLLDRPDGRIDQCRSIVKRGQPHPWRHRLLHLVQPLGDALGDDAAILASEHEGRPDDDFLAVHRRGAGAELAAKLDIGDIGDGHRDAVADGDDGSRRSRRCGGYGHQRGRGMPRRRAG